MPMITSTGGSTTTTVGAAPALPRWLHRPVRTVVAADLTVVGVTVAVAVVAGLGGEPTADLARIGSGAVAAVLLALALPAARAWDPVVVGQGSAEFARVGRAVLLADVALAMIGLGLLVESVREWVFALVPLTGAALMGVRFGLRKVLHRHRGRGSGLTAVLAVGDEEAVAGLVRRTRRDPYFGWVVTGVCVPAGAGPAIEGVPVLGDLDSVPRFATAGSHGVVAVCRAPGWGPARLHRLAWELEGSAVELAVDPGLMEIAGPRMHITPVDGLPLLRLSRPRPSTPARLLKHVADRLGAGLLLVLAAPLFVLVAAAVKSVDGGPVFFRQERVGTHGRTFGMLKFRSMCIDAESLRNALVPDGEGPLFKMRHDPRVTRVGAFLRRYSVDELPQLLNVLGGSMSLVGPRPPLPHEVAAYADDARRRLLVKPGMTGLWQVSGRSSLTWEESIRLDLRYVENWTPALDLLILWKTVGAVLGGRGAY
ncbi:sugar transferase [Pseudonocardia sp. DR1-2]|uniref:sugar transferase n=1 Tax=Pseudonocardia sp. DR1-2 TaxID=2951168 RepID=UPI00204358A9|nr:sugar transferase [Pseudonocardia sp. DR1-2]MCM3846427.1 sugar transferase [Pseudonocardia sp. DR1-2]